MKRQLQKEARAVGGGPGWTNGAGQKGTKETGSVTSEYVGLGDRKLQTTGLASGPNTQFFAEKRKGEILA